MTLVFPAPQKRLWVPGDGGARVLHIAGKIYVKLTDEQVDFATRTGEGWRVRAQERSATDLRDGWMDPITINIVGARGEYAVAIALGREWTGALFDKNKPDVDGPIEVRTVSPKYKYIGARLAMLLHDTDRHDYWPYVLVTSDPPHFTLHGWVYGCEAKEVVNGKKVYWETRGNKTGYWVPVAKLHPMPELVDLLAENDQLRATGGW